MEDSSQKIWQVLSMVDSKICRIQECPIGCYVFLKVRILLEAWGAHADRYERATDPQKNYRPINDILPALFVFNGKWSFWPFSGMSEMTKT